MVRPAASRVIAEKRMRFSRIAVRASRSNASGSDRNTAASTGPVRATHAALRKLRKLRTDTLLPKSMRWVTDFETKLLKAYKKVGKQVEVEKARTLKKAEKPVPKITREDLNNLNLTEDDLEASVCKASFYEFVKAMWEAVSAEVPVWNWHVKYLCDRIQEIAAKNFNEFALMQRKDIADMNSQLRKSLEEKGMVFNTADPLSFRDKLRSSSYYANWRKEFGEEAWALLEKAAGRLA